MWQLVQRFLILSVPGSLSSASRRHGTGQQHQPAAVERFSTIARCLPRPLPPRPSQRRPHRRRRPAHRKRSTNASSAIAHSVAVNIEVGMRDRVSFSNLLVDGGVVVVSMVGLLSNKPISKKHHPPPPLTIILIIVMTPRCTNNT